MEGRYKTFHNLFRKFAVFTVFDRRKGNNLGNFAVQFPLIFFRSSGTMSRNQDNKEGTVTDHHSKDETSGPSMLGAYMLIAAGCVSAVVLANGLCALGGIVLGVLLTLSRS
jgi:hypothetical protein